MSIACADAVLVGLDPSWHAAWPSFKQRVDGSSPSRPIRNELAKFLGDEFCRDADFGRRRAKLTILVVTVPSVHEIKRSR